MGLYPRLLCLAVIASLSAFSLSARAEISAEAKKYLDAALDIIATKSVMTKTDWAKMRATAYLAAKDAKTPADTYAAISGAVASLNDQHSDFITPKQMSGFNQGTEDHSPGMLVMDRYVVRVVPGGPADKAGLRVGMRVLDIDGHPVATGEDFDNLSTKALETGDGRLTLLAEDRQGHGAHYPIVPGTTPIDVDPSGRRLEGGYGYIEISAFMGDDSLGQAYANKVQNAIRVSDQDGLKGWIVDLRLNAGGNMYPMIAGLGPLLGAGELGSFFNASERATWGYLDGSSLASGIPQTTITPYKLKHPRLPIAVLVSDETASSGEIVALSFIGAPRTVLIGGDTSGLTTANSEEPLSDGAILNLCEAIDADRTGKKYGGPIHPNLAVKPAWGSYRTAGDPTILAAKRWIDAHQAGGRKSLPKNQKRPG